jgi:predicted dehydrogenase
MVEKPMALTVRQAIHMNQVAHRQGRILAVAENYRRDPMNRLGKALIDSGAIGSPYLMIQGSSSGGGGVILTPWRHLKSQGGIAADMGVHYADLFEYFLGPVTHVAGMARVVEATRKDAQGTQHMADAEDLVIGNLRFDSGAMGNFILNLAGRAPGWFYRAVFGTGGTLVLPNDRTGHPVHLWREGFRQSGEASEADLLEMVPEFALDPTLALLFGGQRLTRYERDWAETDANLIASELHDFAAAIAHGESPEVSGEQGVRALALIHGFLEADRTNGEVPMDDLISGVVHAYQDSFANAIHDTGVGERGDGK